MKKIESGSADGPAEGAIKVVSEAVPATGSQVPYRQALSALIPYLLGLLGLLLLLAGLGLIAPPTLDASFQTFTTIFLGIFIEAVPFLLAGSVVSGFIEIYVDRSLLYRLVPERPLPAALVGALLGFTFPVCECGVVPVTRRLYGKGLPLAVGVSFLLAAPVINPIVLASTYAAFGWGPVLAGRFAFTVLIAFVVGLIFSIARPEQVLLPETTALSHHDHHVENSNLGNRFWQALTVAGDDFIDMARYLITGSFLAALMQTVVPQSTLLALGGGPVVSVLVLMALAFVLSVCSTVDAFLALSFANTFTTGAILGFLTFGPMVDVKSSLMFLGVFRRRAVAYLILLPLLLNLVIALLINLNLG